jgi:hypothetical protein
MNGNNGIVPTIDLATNNQYPYPMYGNGGFGNGFFGGDGIWAIVLLALLFNGGWGNGGFGNNWGGNNLATTDFVSSEFTQRDISQLATQLCNCCADINSNVSNGFANLNTNLCNVRSDILTGNMGLQNAIQDSKYATALGIANTQRDILMQTTQLENQLGMTSLQGLARLDSCCCDIKSAIKEDGEKTRALITQNTIQDLRDRLAAAKDVISDREQTDTLLSKLQPTPVPSYLVSSPYQSLLNPTLGNGCGCGYGNYYGTNII